MGKIEDIDRSVIFIVVMIFVMVAFGSLTGLIYFEAKDDIKALETQNRVDKIESGLEINSLKQENADLKRNVDFQNTYMKNSDDLVGLYSNMVDDYHAAAKKVLLPYVVEEINYEQQKLSNKRDCMESKTEERCQAEADAYTIEDYREWRDNPLEMVSPDMTSPPPYELGMHDLGPSDCCPPPTDPCFPNDCNNGPL